MKFKAASRLKLRQQLDNINATTGSAMVNISLTFAAIGKLLAGLHLSQALARGFTELHRGYHARYE